MRLLIALVLSAAIFWLIPHTTAPINNSGQKAAAITQQHPASTPKVTAPVQTVSKVEPPAPQTPVAQTVAQGCDSYRDTFAQYSWDVNTAIAICKAESNGNTNAISPTLDRGLMQINWIHSDMVNGDLDSLYSPSINISVAARIYGGAGWRAWSTYNNGAYLSYLN